MTQSLQEEDLSFTQLRFSFFGQGWCVYNIYMIIKRLRCIYYRTCAKVCYLTYVFTYTIYSYCIICNYYTSGRVHKNSMYYTYMSYKKKKISFYYIFFQLKEFCWICLKESRIFLSVHYARKFFFII